MAKKAAVLDIKRQCSCFLNVEKAANAAKVIKAANAAKVIKAANAVKVINAAEAANAAKTVKAADTAAKALQGEPWVTKGASLVS